MNVCTFVQAVAEAPLEHGWSAARFKSAFLQMTHSCQSNVLNGFTLYSSSCFFQWKIMLMFLFKSNVYRSSGISLLKAEFKIWLKGVNFCGVLFCGCFFLRELIFADRGQSAKSAKIRIRKIFMLHGIFYAPNTTHTAAYTWSIPLWSPLKHKLGALSWQAIKFICGVTSFFGCMYTVHIG